MAEEVEKEKGESIQSKHIACSFVTLMGFYAPAPWEVAYLGKNG